MSKSWVITKYNNFNVEPLRLTTIDIKPNQERHRTERPNFILLYSDAAYTEIQTDDETFLIEGPFYIYIPKFTPFLIKNIHNTEQNYLIIEYNISESFANPLIQNYTRLIKDLPTKLNYYFQDILIQSSTPSRYFSDIIRHLFNLIILFEKNETVSNLLDSQQTKLSQGIQSAVYYINNHFHQALTIGQMAAVAGYSPSHFSTIFKREMLLTPNQYLIKYRMQYAHRLLETTKLPIQDVAVECGYHSLSHFSTLFKQHFGYTPKNLQSR